MAELNTASLGNHLQDLLMSPDIEPGDAPSYQLCKDIYIYHPLGAKIVDSPISLAQSQRREVTVPKGPEERLVEAFNREWEKIHANRYIANVGRLCRTYGLASIGLMVKGQSPNSPIDYDTLYDKSIAFNVFDPLNTAGSLVLNQDPMDMDFQKIVGISVNGQTFHRSRFVTIQNEDPIYIAYNVSSFGFNGRSVFQRALFPLKSFVQTMLTDDLIAYKAGVIVTKIKQPGSIIDKAMTYIAGVKRAFVKVAVVGNVISISPDEMIETLNFQNLHNPFEMARKDILDNIATSCDMPAILLNQETFAEGFGEGTEDAKRVAQYINQIRIWLGPLYEFFDKIVQHRAWNPDFYATIQRDFPKEYGKKDYKQAFYEWQNNFEAIWPNFIEEPESERVKVDDVKLKGVIALAETLIPVADPENKGTIVQWLCDTVNANKHMFASPLILDIDAIREYVPPMQQADAQPGGGGSDGSRKLPGNQNLKTPPKKGTAPKGGKAQAGGAGAGLKAPSPAPPFSARDSALASYSEASADLIAHLEAKQQPRNRQRHREPDA